MQTLETSDLITCVSDKKHYPLRRVRNCSDRRVDISRGVAHLNIDWKQTGSCSFSFKRTWHLE